MKNYLIENVTNNTIIIRNKKPRGFKFVKIISLIM